jgi:hypothetical protein
MRVMGARCHELRIRDAEIDWRIVYRSDADAIVILEVFGKTAGQGLEARHHSHVPEAHP